MFTLNLYFHLSDKKMEKVFVTILTCLFLFSCITPVQYHIIDKGNVADTSFTTEFVKVIGEIGYCRHPVILCERIDSLLGNKKVKWADDVYTIELINDSIWRVKRDFIPRPRGRWVYGGCSIYYVRKSDGKVMFVEGCK